MASLLKCSFLILLTVFLTLVAVSAKGSGEVLHRQKREWIIAPRQLHENKDYTGYSYIARIRSDKENFTKIFYSLSGPGVNQPPIGIFSIDENTGYVKVHSILDREQRASYNLKGLARYATGGEAEKEIDLKIIVLDANDCPPVIKVQQVGSVKEGSAKGTLVMRVIATDADQEGTLHSKIHYSIVESSNTAGMFSINSQTGEIFVARDSLDRETKDSYKVAIQVADMGGQQGAITSTGEVQIRILDRNDNIPYLERETYVGQVMENTINTEVMRIQAVDMDMIHTDSWLAVYKIVSGNEAGYFTITTDEKTNEGVIMIKKALDYEELKELNLQVSLSNKAVYDFSPGLITTEPKSYPIKINVINQKEGPRFQPTVKVVTVSEDSATSFVNKVITTYTAIDSDTLKTATNVKYQKFRDVDNWFIINEKTGEIRLNKSPDRESKFLVNGTYYGQIVCITTDESIAKTATGTIALQVKDFNDHCPKLTSTNPNMCLEDNFIIVTAVDEDERPNSAPFEFSVIKESSQGKWTVEPLNETSAILRDHASLWPGIYKVAVEVKDQQGKSCDEVQVMDVVVCTCKEDRQTCNSRTGKVTSFGAPGILLLLLGLLLLLLLPCLLLFCLCGGAADGAGMKAIPFAPKPQLVSYHTEGQGEDKIVPLLQIPVDLSKDVIDTKDIRDYGAKGHFEEHIDAGRKGAYGGFIEKIDHQDHFTTFRRQFGSDYKREQGWQEQEQGYYKYREEAFDGMALSGQFLSDYYSTKSNFAAQQSQEKDALQVYDYEGRESLAGSVGCCSLLEKDDDLTFLNDLGPKFKTLAEICTGTTLTQNIQPEIPKFPPVVPPISTDMHVQIDAVKKRDHTKITTLDTSHVTSGSSVTIQEEQITKQGSVTLPTVHAQDKVVVPSQTVLIQQPPMYYAAAPMYVVESNPQMMLVAGGTQQAVGQVGQVAQVGQVGLGQGLVQVGGLQGAQGVVLVDNQVRMGGVTGQVAQGFVQGTISKPRQVLVVGNGSSGGEQVAHLAQGVVQTGHGSVKQALEVKGQGVKLKTSSVRSQGSIASNEDLALSATPRVQGSQRVVVQHKKVSVTEKNTST
ncbi:uncharacterized protein V6R79_019638 [Siganus canaliculatus]